MNDKDRAWMRRALAKAQKGQGYVEPNPMVGAIVVRDGELVGSGYHAKFGGPHAEVFALQEAGERARGATLYITLEPCCHFGKTPPCTDAIIAAGIKRVVAALRDPFPKVSGGGFARLREAGIDVEVGCEAEAAALVLGPFLKRQLTGLPYVTAKWAETRLGSLEPEPGQGRWISNEESRKLVHILRGRVDSILVGIGTALADDPLLTARPPGPRVPVRVVLDSAAWLPVSSQLVQTAREVPTWVAVTERATQDRIDALTACGCEVFRFPGEGRVPIDALLRVLGERGHTNLMVEGGPKVLKAFFEGGHVDEVDVYADTSPFPWKSSKKGERENPIEKVLELSMNKEQREKERNDPIRQAIDDLRKRELDELLTKAAEHLLGRPPTASDDLHDLIAKYAWAPPGLVKLASRRPPLAPPLEHVKRTSLGSNSRTQGIIPAPWRTAVNLTEEH